MRVFTGLAVSIIALIAVTGCNGSPLPDGKSLVTRARRAWEGNWRAVWQIEWNDAPVRGSLVVEVWHAADNRLRIETLEAPTAALSGLTLVDDGAKTWLYDLRQNRIEAGSNRQVRIPLASDALETIDWLLFKMDSATIKVAGRDTLESGPATRLDIVLDTGDRAALWVHEETGLPARVELRSAIRGTAIFTTRDIDTPEHQPPALFVSPLEGATGQPPPGTDMVR